MKQLQGAGAGGGGGGGGGYTVHRPPPAFGHGHAVGMADGRPGWIDPSSTGRPQDSIDIYGSDRPSEGGTGRRHVFKSSDPRDIALSACPDRHTLR